MEIVFLDSGTLYNAPNLNIFESLGTYTQYEHTLPEQTAERLKNATIAITNKVVLSAPILDQCLNLKLICVAATGTNNIDLKAAASKGIAVKNVAGYSTQSVAQITWSMILQLWNQIGYYDQYVKNGSYTKHLFFTHVGRPFAELHSKTLGIIGLGTIGKKVASIAEAFGMQVCYTSLSGSDRSEPYTKYDLKTLLQTSDIVTIHAPFNEHSKQSIGYTQLEWMKPSAIIVNAGRGGIVVESDMVRALNSGIIQGYATDVYEQEPILENNPLLHVNEPHKLVLLPHIAWASIEARTKLLELVAANIRAFQNG